MRVELAVRNALVVTPTSSYRATIGIEDGRMLGTETNPATTGSKPESEIRLKMYDDLAMQVVRLFHAWKPDSSDTSGPYQP